MGSYIPLFCLNFGGWVAAGGHHPLADPAGGRRPHHDQRHHVDRGDGAVVECPERGPQHPLAWASHVGNHRRGAVRGPVLRQDLHGPTELPAAPSRAWVVQRDHQVALGHGSQSPLDHGPRREQIRERHRRVVVAQRRPEHRRGPGGRGHTGHDRRLGVAVVGCQLAHQRGHGEDAGIARAHQGDALAPCSSVQRLGAACRLGPDGGTYDLVARSQQIGRLVDIRPVADDDVGATHRGRRSGCAPHRLARTQTDHRQMSRGAEAPGHGHRRFGRRLLGDGQSRAGSGGMQGGGLGHTRGADGGVDDRARVGNLDLAQRCGREGAQLDAEVEGQRHDPRLVPLEVDGGDQADRGRAEPSVRQCPVGQLAHLPGIDARRRPDPDDQRRGP